MTLGPRRVAGPVGEDRLPHSARLVLGHLGEAGAGDQLHGGEDPAHEVGAAGAHVLVGGVEDRLERGPERLLARHVALPELLERVAGVVGAGPLRVVVGLLVAAARDVVLEEPPDARFLVVAREDRHDHETLHRGRQVHADHLAEPVGLPLEREVLTLDLLVVLELGLEEPGHLRRGPGRTGDADAAELVGLEDLLDTPARDRKPAVACRSPAMMTPSRYRTDNTVVPCGGSRGASVGAGDAPGIRCGASRRSRSTKLGFEESLKPRQRSPASIIAVTFRRSTARCCGAGRPRSVIR